MKERRYKKEYRIVTDVDPRTGKPREVAVYDGDYHRFPQGTPPAKRRALSLAPWATLFWLLALAYLRFGRLTSHCLYALVPMMAALLPGAYALMGLASLYRAPERMTVVQKENGPGRLTRSALGCGIFSAVGSVGCAVYLSLEGLWQTGWHEPILCATACACAWLLFARARRDYREMAKN